VKKFFKDFFSVENGINENTVMGVVFSVALLTSTFVTFVPEDKYYILAGLVASFFTIGAFKK
jgi:hypothetical protein